MKINKEKIAIISDLHLGSHLDSTVWHNIAIDFATTLKAKLLTDSIVDIIILGDIFNNREEISVTTINTAERFFDVLKDFNIIMIVGNHDCYYKDRTDINSIGILHGRNNVTIISELTLLNVFGKELAFCPWKANLDIIVDPVDILFGHLEIKNFNLSQYEVNTEHGLNSKDVLSKAKLVFSGHFHYKDERKYENGDIIYVGNPYQLYWGDYSLDKGFYELNIRTGQYSFIKNTTSPIHIKYTLSSLFKSGITSHIKETFPKNIVKIIIDQKIDQDKCNILYDKLLSLKPLLLKFEYDIPEIDLPQLDTTPEEFIFEKDIVNYVNNMEITNKKDVIDYMKDLYKKVTEEVTVNE